MVSIITPCYNSRLYISKTIESVISQTYENWEMIIVDDCSEDNSVEIIEKYQKQDSRIILILNDKPSGSPTFPRNRAIEQAKGKYIAFLDSDDLWLPTKLEEQLMLFSDNVALVYSNYEKIDIEGNRNNRFVIGPETVDYNTLLKSNVIGCLTVIYDTDLVGKQFFKNIGHEDFLMWLNILKKGFNAKNTNLVHALYRVGTSSVSSNKLRAINWYWNIIRNEEKLGFFNSIYCLINYSLLSLIKFIK